jgi:glycosyltransferase involved in cell wall biosynthesis
MATICILLPGHWGSTKGGAEFQAHTFAEYLALSTNHHVVYLTKRPPANVSEYGYEIRRIESRVGQRFGMFWDSIPLYRALKDLAPKVVIQRVACAYTGVAAIYCARHGSSLIWHVSSDRDVAAIPYLPVGRMARIIDTALFQYGVRHASAIVTQTQDQARTLQRAYARVPTSVISNFHAPSPTSMKSQRFTVVWVANLKPLKRPEAFIRLARELAQFDISFKMIGRGDPSSWCRGTLEQIANTRNIEYLGELEQEEVNSQLASAHLLVNTSVYEGLPNTFIQAWMHEVPTVTLGVDPDGMITQRGLGYCAPDFDRLVAQVLRYSHDRQTLRADGARARDFAMKQFSMNNAHDLSMIVEGVLSRPELLGVSQVQ